MAEKRYYAWSRIAVDADRDENDPTLILRHNYIEPGTVVTPKKLGVTDENWQYLVESGAVRTQKYPDMPEGYPGSPIDWLREQAKRAATMGEIDPDAFSASDSAVDDDEDDEEA